jgi:hypothetical protein
MNEGVYNNVPGSDDCDSVPSGDGEDDDQDSIDDEPLDVSRITNDELATLVLDDRLHILQNVVNRQTKKKKKNKKRKGKDTPMCIASYKF